MKTTNNKLKLVFPILLGISLLFLAVSSGNLDLAENPDGHYPSEHASAETGENPDGHYPSYYSESELELMENPDGHYPS